MRSTGPSGDLFRYERAAARSPIAVAGWCRRHWVVAVFACALSFLGASSAKCDQDFVKYDIAFVAIDANMETARLACSDDEKPCRATISIQENNISVKIEVEILLEPGYAYFKFRKDGKYLLADGTQDYFVMSLGGEGGPTRAVALYDDVINLRDQDVLSSVRHPVWRFPGGAPLAILSIAIRARR